MPLSLLSLRNSAWQVFITLILLVLFLAALTLGIYLITYVAGNPIDLRFTEDFWRYFFQTMGFVLHTSAISLEILGIVVGIFIGVPLLLFLIRLGVFSDTELEGAKYLIDRSVEKLAKLGKINASGEKRFRLKLE